MRFPCATHLPLYRQHQRLEAAGVHLARSTLTSLAHRTIDLLEPIYAAQVDSILSGQVLAMDETPIKAGRRERTPPERGRMNLAHFWPIYGDQDEIAFPFATTRATAVVRQVLKSYVGVLLTDGYKAYNRHARAVNGTVHASCWSHTRRQFVEAEFSEPALAREAEEKFGRLYAVEAAIKARMLCEEETRTYRALHARPIVDEIFVWLRATLDRETLLPSSLFAKAARYALTRENELRVFLEYPSVPIDTNHLERAIRPIALGRKNWNFCWTELRARYVGIIQSLLATCRVQGVDPYTYLVDVLQRIETHPAKDVALLTPRLWKENFGGHPLQSDIDRASCAYPRLRKDSVRRSFTAQPANISATRRRSDRTSPSPRVLILYNDEGRPPNQGTRPPRPLDRVVPFYRMRTIRLVTDVPPTRICTQYTPAATR